MPNCPFYYVGAKLSWCQIVWCQIVRCQIVWCQIVQCQIVWCQIVRVPNCRGDKLSGANLSWCQIVLVPNCLVPNCPVPNCPTTVYACVVVDTHCSLAFNYFKCLPLTSPTTHDVKFAKNPPNMSALTQVQLHWSQVHLRAARCISLANFLLLNFPPRTLNKAMA